MTYQAEIEAKTKELEALKVRASHVEAYSASLRVGQCFTSKSDQLTGKIFYKILYIDDSGYGYKLIIAEHIGTQDLELFKSKKGRCFDAEYHRVTDGRVFFNIEQQYNFEAHMDYLCEVTTDEYNRARSKVMAILANPQISPCFPAKTIRLLQKIQWR